MRNKDMGMKQNDIHAGVSKKQKAAELTSHLMHRHYGENDVESIIGLFDEELFWFGTGEEEYATGTDTVAGIFRQFAGQVPKCNITDEEYEVMELAPDVYLCIGRMWIATDPSTNIYLRVHQRVTAVFRWVKGNARCCHIHVSNPYEGMAEGDVGFPAQIGYQSYLYLQECVSEQKKKIEEQTVLLKRLSFEDSLTGLFNRNKFNEVADNSDSTKMTSLGIAVFDLNGLKETNDSLGHNAGDDYIRLAANCVDRIFHKKAFRIGGDEFVVILPDVDEHTFCTSVDSVCEDMKNNGVSISAGLCWRDFNLNIHEQFEEADKLMYQQKAIFYQAMENDRRKEGI